MNTDLDALWQRFHADHDKPARDALIVAYQPLVRSVALQVLGGLGGVDLDDLMSHGQLGLIDAINRFEAERGLQFATFASPRIKGAIFDGIREFEPGGRRHRRAMKSIDMAAEHLRHQLKREPTDREIAGHLEITEAKVHATRSQDMARNTKPLEAKGYDHHDQDTGSGRFSGPASPASRSAGADSSAEAGIELAEFKATVAKAFAQIEGPERIVLALYYVDKLRMADIGRVLGVSQSMVSKLHAKGVSQLREQIEEIGSAWGH